jgi:hypothetical protein
LIYTSIIAKWAGYKEYTKVVSGIAFLRVVFIMTMSFSYVRSDSHFLDLAQYQSNVTYFLLTEQEKEGVIFDPLHLAPLEALL